MAIPGMPGMDDDDKVKPKYEQNATQVKKKRKKAITSLKSSEINARTKRFYPSYVFSSKAYNPVQELYTARQSPAVEKAIDTLDFAGNDDKQKEKQRGRFKDFYNANLKSGLDTLQGAAIKNLRDLETEFNGKDMMGFRKWGPKLMRENGPRWMEEHHFRLLRGELAAKHAQEKKALEKFCEEQDNPKMLGDEKEELVEKLKDRHDQETAMYNAAESKTRVTFRDKVNYNVEWTNIVGMQTSAAIDEAKKNRKERLQKEIDQFKAANKDKLTPLEDSLNPANFLSAWIPETPEDDILRDMENELNNDDGLPELQDFTQGMQLNVGNVTIQMSKDANNGLHLIFRHDPRKGPIEKDSNVIKALYLSISAIEQSQIAKGIPPEKRMLKFTASSEGMARAQALAAIAKGYDPKNITLMIEGQAQPFKMPDDIVEQALALRGQTTENQADSAEKILDRLEVAAKNPTLSKDSSLRLPEIDPAKAESLEDLDDRKVKLDVEYNRTYDILDRIATKDGEEFYNAVADLNKLSYDPQYNKSHAMDNWGRNVLKSGKLGASMGAGVAGGAVGGVLNTIGDGVSATFNYTGLTSIPLVKNVAKTILSIGSGFNTAATFVAAGAGGAIGGAVATVGGALAETAKDATTFIDHQVEHITPSVLQSSEQKLKDNRKNQPLVPTTLSSDDMAKVKASATKDRDSLKTQYDNLTKEFETQKNVFESQAANQPNH